MEILVGNPCKEAMGQYAHDADFKGKYQRFLCPTIGVPGTQYIQTESKLFEMESYNMTPAKCMPLRMRYTRPCTHLVNRSKSAGEWADGWGMLLYRRITNLPFRVPLQALNFLIPSLPLSLRGQSSRRFRPHCLWCLEGFEPWNFPGDECVRVHDEWKGGGS